MSIEQLEISCKKLVAKTKANLLLLVARWTFSKVRGSLESSGATPSHLNSAVTLDGEVLVDAFFGLLLAVFERGIGLLAMSVPHTVVWVGLYFMGCPVHSVPAQPHKTETTVSAPRGHYP